MQPQQPLRPLPRTLHSLHPSLAPMAAAGAGMPGAVLGSASPFPYPTIQQYASSEEAYRDALLAHHYESQQ